MRAGTAPTRAGDLRLEYVPVERKILELLRRWAPSTGYGEVTIRVEWHNGAPVMVTRLNSEEKVKLA